jgi:hypothetical protein
VIWGCQGIPLILANIILANSDSIINTGKHNIHNKFSDFYFGEFLKIAKIGQNYIPAKKTGYTVFEPFFRQIMPTDKQAGK